MGYLISFVGGLGFAYCCAWAILGKRLDLLGSLRALRRPLGPFCGSQQYCDTHEEGCSCQTHYAKPSRHTKL